jgi:hypothetical protein
VSESQLLVSESRKKEKHDIMVVVSPVRALIIVLSWINFNGKSPGRHSLHTSEPSEQRNKIKGEEGGTGKQVQGKKGTRKAGVRACLHRACE